MALWRYWNEARGDNFCTTAAKVSGYRRVQLDGYIYPTQNPGTIPLKLFWHSGRGDNYVAATPAGQNAARSARYKLVKTIGFIYESPARDRTGRTPRKPPTTSAPSPTERVRQERTTSKRPTLTIVTYNCKSHDTVAGKKWRKRIQGFARNIVAPYYPDIIGLQEVYLGSKRCVCDHCADLNSRAQMSYLLEAIREEIGITYLVATTLRQKHALVCGGVSEEWEGISVIYNPHTMRLVPFDRDNGYGREARNWKQEGWREMSNDAVVLSEKRKASKSIFEFPIGTKQYVYLYNTHLVAGDQSKNYWQATQVVDFVLDRHAESNHRKFPPILIGDMNRGSHPLFSRYFEDPIGSKHIDKILIGRPTAIDATIGWATSTAGALDLTEKRIFPANDFSDHPVVLFRVTSKASNTRFTEAVPTERRPLDVFWSAKRKEHAAAATERRRRNILTANAGYRLVKSEGKLLSRAAPGTIPVHLYWSAKRGDHVIAATSSFRRAVEKSSAEYRDQGVQGWVYQRERPGTRLLEIYWSKVRQDHVPVVSDYMRHQVKSSEGEYTLVSREGYVPW